MSVEQQNDKKIAQFLEGKRVLIVDPDAATRTSTQRMLATMGIKSKDIVSAWTFHDALNHIESNKPQIVLADFVLDRNSGVDLLNAHKRVLPNRLETIFMFISSRNSNTIACLAAAEEVDALMIKPFSFMALKDKFIEMCAARAYATDYQREIEAAKTHLREKRLTQATTGLEKAKTLDPAPSLVCYYQGVIARDAGRQEVAESAFREGLDYNPVHYRCLKGLLDLTIARKDFEKAYELAQRLAQNYPIEPGLIPVLIRLSIASKNFADIVRYYEIFEDLNEKDQNITNYISAGLIVCAKYFFETRRLTDGLNALAKAETACDRKPQIMKEILATLYAAGLEAEATAFLERAPLEIRNSPEVAAAKLEKINTSAPPSRVLAQANELLAAGVRHPRIYEIALARSIELMHRETHIRQLLDAAVKHFPERREAFERIVSQAMRLAAG